MEFPRLRTDLRLGHCGRVLCKLDWHMPASFWEELREFDLWYVWAGHGEMITHAGTARLQPGVCFWMRPGGRYQATAGRHSRLGVNYIRFRAAPKTITKSATEKIPELFRPSNRGFVDETMREILSLAGRSRWMAEELLFVLLRHLLWEQALQSDHGGNAKVSPQQRQIVDQLVMEIRDHLEDSFSVAHLAERAGYSPDHFTRTFKAVVGKSPQNYLIDCRIEKARELLAETSLKIEEVALRLKFNNVYFFSRQFKQRTGQTPSGFRQHCQSTGY